MQALWRIILLFNVLSGTIQFLNFSLLLVIEFYLYTTMLSVKVIKLQILILSLIQIKILK